MAEGNSQPLVEKSKFFATSIKEHQPDTISESRLSVRQMVARWMYDHTCWMVEECVCRICNAVTAAYERDQHNWLFCGGDPEQCDLCRGLIDHFLTEQDNRGR